MRTLFLLATLAIALPSAAQSADAPATVAPLSVQAALDSADDARVTVRGEIARVVRREHYVLSDGTADIEIEIDDDLMRPEDVRVGMRVEVYGEIERDRDEPVELEAERVTTL